MYKLNGRRCVSETDCRNYTTALVKHFKAFNDSATAECLPQCPAGYTTKQGAPHSCEKCKGPCPHVCTMNRAIKSIHDAKSLKGCTIINSGLNIEITSGVGVSTALEEYLGNIEEIQGYLKVARTPSLVSLAFFKNLRLINGTQAATNYSVLVQDNANLQEFWDWKTKPNFRIKTGKLYFHHNQKLCYKTIETFKNNSGLSALVLKDQDVSERTNGDRMPCDVVELPMRIHKIRAKKCSVEWDTHIENVFEDHRHLHTYTVFYARVAEDVNVTVFDGRDACGSDDWSTAYKDLDAMRSESAGKEEIELNDLEPFSRYAVYVKTEMLIESSKAAQSKIQYFRTKMGPPNLPRKIYVDSTTPHDMDIRWDPPDKPTGKVEWYLVVGLVQQDIDAYMTRRDFCTDHVYSPHPTTAPKTEKSNATLGVLDCSKCKCDARLRKTLSRQEKQEAMEFEDELHDLIFRKRGKKKSGRHKRSVPENASKEPNDLDDQTTTATSTKVSQNSLTAIEENWGNIPDHYKNCSSNIEDASSFCRWIRGDRTSVSNLRHFTNYIIEVAACHYQSEMSSDESCHFETEVNIDGKLVKTCCSKPQRVVQRTLKLRGADDVDISTLRVEQRGVPASGGNVTLEGEHAASAGNLGEGNVFVTWDPPPRPNAFIVSYTLEYIRDVDGAKAIQICINHKEYQQVHGRVLDSLGAGNYSFRVRATSLSGAGNWTRYESFYVRDTSEGQRYVTLFVSIAIIFLVIFGVASFGVYHYAKRKLNRGIPDGVLYASMNPEYLSTSYEPDEWEVQRDKIQLLNELGQGSFGMVYQGIVYELNGVPETDCAVKTVNEGAQIHERNEFLQEASTMKRFNSYHVVKLLGVVSKGQPVYVIMELMSNGDLKSYLRSHRPDQGEAPKGDPPTYRQVVQMAAEIADGMAYLASLKYVHRDLAARNCMVATDLTVKIGDFGMTRDIYETDYYRKGGKGLLPVRWMSPESLKDGIFTTQGDVWSYGVVLWEMVTLATMPYQGLSNEQVLKWVISRHIMERPDNCPDKLYKIMKLCWQYMPKTRPKFTDIVSMLLDETHDRFQEVSYYTTTFRGTMRPEENLEDRQGTSGEGTPLVVAQSHKNGGGLASIRDHKSPRGPDAAGHDIADLDEESNLYISDDVISDGEGEESGGENSDSSERHPRHKNTPMSSLTKHNNSDYGSEKSPTIVPLLSEREAIGDGPPVVMLTPAPRPAQSSGFTSLAGLTPIVQSFAPSDGNGSTAASSVPAVKAVGGKVLTTNQNGTLPTTANGRAYIPLHGNNNRTTAC
ncbi:insulin-like growth factor 1 receptor isoform X4 [Varroa destructor]|uniref:Tyrosine-protein kinase receptor n=1 Tax=Varroa destructor TaxID=109461 RepID=A0A7M7KPW6_VARDE|nr:insulin-like growth factor 1 receptor isoform X4 [Varroa destructor]